MTLDVLGFLADGWRAALRRCLASGAAKRISSNGGAFLPYRGTGAVGRYWNESPSAFLLAGLSSSK